MIPDRETRRHAHIRPGRGSPPATGAYPGAVTNEPTAELPAQRGSGTAPAWADAGTAARVDTTPAGRTAAGPTGPRETAPAHTAPGPAGDVVATTDHADRTAAALPVPPAADGPSTTAGHRRRRWPVVLLSLLLAAALGAAGYLYATTTAYVERLAWTEDRAREIGTELVTTRGELEGVTAELEAVRAQLATAQERITALADEKAQIGDDREAQAQLLDYQARVSEAAGTVASALDRCVQGQDQLIAYLEDADSYDPADLTKFGSDVEALCRSASDANVALQAELAER